MEGIVSLEKLQCTHGVTVFTKSRLDIFWSQTLEKLLNSNTDTVSVVAFKKYFNIYKRVYFDQPYNGIQNRHSHSNVTYFVPSKKLIYKIVFN